MANPFSGPSDKKYWNHNSSYQEDLFKNRGSDAGRDKSKAKMFGKDSSFAEKANGDRPAYSGDRKRQDARPFKEGQQRPTGNPRFKNDGERAGGSFKNGTPPRSRADGGTWEDRPKQKFEGKSFDKPLHREFKRKEDNRSFGEQKASPMRKPKFEADKGKYTDTPFERKHPEAGRGFSSDRPQKSFELKGKKPFGESVRPYKKEHKPDTDFKSKNIKAKAPLEKIEAMPLNQYIEHSGECSRRDAVELVKQGKVRVNGELALGPRQKINEGDQITVSGKKLYIMLKKPKENIATNDDQQGMRSTMEPVEGVDTPDL